MFKNNYQVSVSSLSTFLKALYKLHGFFFSRGITLAESCPGVTLAIGAGGGSMNKIKHAVAMVSYM